MSSQIKKYRYLDVDSRFSRLASSVILSLALLLTVGCSDDGSSSRTTPTDGKVLIFNNALYTFDEINGDARKLRDINEGLFLELNTSVDPIPEDDDEETDEDTGPILDDDFDNEIANYEVIVDEFDHIAYVEEDALYLLNARTGKVSRLATFEAQICELSKLQRPDPDLFITRQNQLQDLSLVIVAVNNDSDCDLTSRRYFSVSFEVTDANDIDNIQAISIEKSLATSTLLIQPGSPGTLDDRTHGYLGYDEEARQLHFYRANLSLAWETEFDFTLGMPTVSEDNIVNVLVQRDNDIFIIKKADLLNLLGPLPNDPDAVPVNIPQDRLFSTPAATLDASFYMPINSTINDSLIVFEYGDGLYTSSSNLVTRVHDKIPGMTYIDFVALDTSNIIIAEVDISGDRNLIAIYPESKEVVTLVGNELGDFRKDESSLYVNTHGDTLFDSSAILYNEELTPRVIEASQWVLIELRNKSSFLVYILTGRTDDLDQSHLFEYDPAKFSGGFDLGFLEPELPVKFDEYQFITNDIGVLGYTAGEIILDDSLPPISFVDPDNDLSTIELTAP